MKLITVEATFASADFAAATSLFASQADAVRQMAGCAHYALYTAAGQSSIAIIQRWETSEDFDAYRSSDTFAQLGAGLRPLMTAPPVTSVAEIDTV